MRASLLGVPHRSPLSRDLTGHDVVDHDPRVRVKIMIVDSTRLRIVVRAVLGADRIAPFLTVDEARVIVAIGYLALEADLDEDSDELATLDAITQQVCELAGIPPSALPPLPVTPVPLDHEERRSRIRQLASRLTRRHTRELAYAIAYIVVISDLQLSPSESDLLDDVQRTLELDDRRAGELATTVAELLTPMESAPDEARTEI